MEENYGFSEIFKRKTSIFIRILWIIVLILSVSGLGFYINECYQKYKVTPEVLVNEKFVNSRTIPFPAISICPAINVKMEYINISKFVDQMAENLTLNSEDQKFMAANIYSCLTAYKDSNIFKLLKDTLKENIIDTMLKVAPTVNDFFDSCIINGYSGCENIFIRNFETNGICFTFNMQGYHSIFNKGMHRDFDVYKRKKITKVWKKDAKVEYYDDENFEEPNTWSQEKGYMTNNDSVHPIRANGWAYLIIKTKTNVSELSNACSIKTGAYKVHIHPPNERPIGMHLFNFVDWDMLNFIRVDAEVKKLDTSLRDFSIEQRRCYFEDERELRFYKAYTKINCEIECYTNFTYKTCNCAVYGMPRTTDMRICSLNDMDCWMSVDTGWPQKYYEESYNKENFPDFPCNCLPTCTKIKYNVLIESSAKLKSANDNFTHTKLAILFGSSQIKETTNYVTYKIQNFVSDIGGLVGLFLGLSLLSIFEFFLNIWGLIKRYLNRPVRKIEIPKGSLKMDLRHLRKIRINDTIIDVENMQAKKERERKLFGNTVRFDSLSATNLEALFKNN